MRVGLIVDNIGKGAGTERAIVNMVNGFRRLYNSEFEFYIISLFSADGEKSYFKLNEKVIIIHLNIKNSPSNFRKPIFYYHLHNVIIKIYKHNSLDILIGTTYVHNCVMGVRKLFDRKFKFIGCEHVTHNYPLKIIQLFRKFIYRHLDALVVLNEFEKNKFKYLNNSFVIPNSLSVPTKTLSDKDINSPINQIISVGRLHFEKGMDLFLEVVRQIHLKRKELKFKIYGVGEEYENLNLLIKKYDLESVCVLKGLIPDIDKVYTTDSLLLSTSRTESFGMTVIEAMAYGLPVISFDNSGPKSIIKNYHDAVLIKFGNVEKMATECINLIENQSLRAQIRLNALETSKNYDQEKIVHLWRELFEELCGQ